MAHNPKLYPEDWKDRIRPDILKRAGYKCEFCRVRQRAKGYRDKNGEFVDCDDFMLNWARKNGKKVITIFLAIIHLDHNTENNEYSNLKAACQKCHNNYDKDFRQFNRISRQNDTL